LTLCVNIYRKNNYAALAAPGQKQEDVKMGCITGIIMGIVGLIVGLFTGCIGLIIGLIGGVLGLIGGLINIIF
jgi:uncharacterized membrane protein